MSQLKTMYWREFPLRRHLTYGAAIILAMHILCAEHLSAADVTIALPARCFQQIIFPPALERGDMKEEGIDLKITFMEPTRVFDFGSVLQAQAQLNKPGLKPWREIWRKWHTSVCQLSLSQKMSYFEQVITRRFLCQA